MYREYIKIIHFFFPQKLNILNFKIKINKINFNVIRYSAALLLISIHLNDTFYVLSLKKVTFKVTSIDFYTHDWFRLHFYWYIAFRVGNKSSWVELVRIWLDSIEIGSAQTQLEFDTNSFFSSSSARLEFTSSPVWLVRFSSF
jgi:hypothetical protein